MKKIDIHTHLLPPELPRWAEKFQTKGFIHLEKIDSCKAKMVRDDGTVFREVDHRLWDPAERLKDCDRDEVSVQVLSTVPVMFCYGAMPEHAEDVARFLNDHMAKTVATNPKRFVGLGTVPLQNSDRAIKELHRCVKELGFAGVEIGSHVNGRNLDDPEIVAFLAEAERLGAAVFVHPWDMLAKDRMKDYWLPWLVGMPTEMALAISTMIFGGVFEKHPKLRVAFAHGGGAFPGILGRLEHGFRMRPDLVAHRNPHSPRQYLGRFFVDSLVTDEKFLRYLIDLMGSESICLGSDYPFPLGEAKPGSLIEGMNLLQKEREDLLFGSAERWLYGRK